MLKAMLIEQLKHNHFMLVVSQMLQCTDKSFGIFRSIQHVAKDDDKRPARRGLCDLVQRIDRASGSNI